MKVRTPPGWSTITVRIVTPDVGGFITFLKAAFEAKGDFEAARPTEMMIGESRLMISDGGGVRPDFPAFLHLYVDDADAVYAQAKRAGARSLEAPTTMPWGDRRATVADNWGNVWQIATSFDTDSVR